MTVAATVGTTWSPGPTPSAEQKAMLVPVAGAIFNERSVCAACLDKASCALAGQSV